MTRDAAIVLSIVAAVLVTSPLHSGLNNPNEGVRVYGAKALVEDGTFAIDRAVRAWGFIDDKATKDGALYSSKAPLVSLLGAAAYAVVHPVTGDLSRPVLTRLCRAVAAVPVALALALLAWAMRQRPRALLSSEDLDRGVNDDDIDLTNDLFLVGLVIGTGVLASLHVTSGHALAAVAPASVIAVWRSVRAPSLVVVAACAALLTIAACAEYPAALCLPFIALVVRRSARRVMAVVVAGAAAVVAALPTLWAHTAMWGAPWRTGYSYLESAQYRPLVEGGLFGIGTPSPSTLVTVLVSPELGLFFFSPFLLFGVLGLMKLVREARSPAPVDEQPLLGIVDDRSMPNVARSDVIIISAVVVFTLLFIAGFRGWRGGWSVGPRYISELSGVFAILAVDGVLSRRRRGAAIVVWAAFVAISVVHSGLAGAFFPHLPDVLRAPVGELVLPMIWRGFCPDGPALILGVPAATAALVTAAVVLAPLIVVGVVYGRFGLIGACAVAVVASAVLNVVLAPDSAKSALEVRRMMDNWSPARGVPYADDIDEAPAATLVAIDRAREVRAPVDCRGTRPARADVGPGSGVLPAALALVDDADGGLVVVDDRLADHIAPAGGRGLVVTASDLKRWKTLPCEGEVFVVAREGETPERLRGLKEKAPRRALPEGFVLEVRGR